MGTYLLRTLRSAVPALYHWARQPQPHRPRFVRVFDFRDRGR